MRIRSFTVAISLAAFGLTACAVAPSGLSDEQKAQIADIVQPVAERLAKEALGSKFGGPRASEGHWVASVDTNELSLRVELSEPTNAKSVKRIDFLHMRKDGKPDFSLHLYADGDGYTEDAYWYASLGIPDPLANYTTLAHLDNLPASYKTTDGAVDMAILLESTREIVETNSDLKKYEQQLP